AERDLAFKFLHRHLIRRWHSSRQPILIFGGGRGKPAQPSDIEHANSRYDAARTAPNSIPFYRENHSRITGEGNCLHLEWRGKGARAVRAAGIAVGDLLDFDHHAFWKKRLLLLDGEPELLGKFLRNCSSGKRSRVATPDDSKAGGILSKRFETMQQLI